MVQENFKELFFDELREIFNAEKQIVNALPSLISAADSSDLVDAFKTHLGESEKQVDRLNQIFRILNIEASEVPCAAMEGLIKECNDTVSKFSRSELRDAALITKAQRVEHYEMAVYGALRTFANHLDLSEVSDLLQESLNEEGNANKTLTKIAEGNLLFAGINQKAML